MFRLASPADYPQIATIWRLGWASANPQVTTIEPIEHWEVRVIQEFVPPMEVHVVAAGDRLKAFYVIDPRTSYLYQVFVNPLDQGQGLGAKILAQVNVRFPEGWNLHVASTNLRALSFYRRNGLVAVGTDTNPSTGRSRIECRKTA